MNDYSKTLNLPKTDFSMRANLKEREPLFIKKWDEENIYNKSLKGDKEFIFHDGPPYANGDIHLGTSFNKILKDITVKYKRLKGFKAPFIPGWDTHGLPIEMAVVKSGALVGDKLKLRAQFRAHAEKYIIRQKADFKRLGILADWDNPYITMDPKFEANQLRIFAKMVENNHVYNSLKPVYWCTKTKTALAEAEIVYKEHISDSIYFKVKANIDVEEKLFLKELYFTVWTTTPWTLPGNVAIALNSSIEYIVSESAHGNLILAKDLFDSLKDKLSLTKIIKNFDGLQLENCTYVHPFIAREGKVIVAEHVTNESGTGCVHTAPAHGVDDFLVAKKYDLEIICVADEAGYVEGELYLNANGTIIKKLGDNLIVHEKFEHSYPYSERGQVPIIFRATKQWFVDISKIKDQAINLINKVNFYPKIGENRLKAMINSRPDWCISRQRLWGVPIPALDNVLDVNVINKIADVVETEGSDVLFIENYFSKYFDGELGKDIFDVWFDSGCSYSILDKEADLYFEGSDQHRGWFQSSLITSVSAYGKAPYKNIVTHGYVLDGNGVKMSKSLGNVILPQEVVDKFGADVLRLWTASVDSSNDVRISESILQQHSENYRKIRNAFRFMLANIGNETKDLLKIDRLALLRTYDMMKKVELSYENYQFRDVISEVLLYLTEMSSFYFDIIKDRLYAESANSFKRLSAQTVLREILYNLTKILSPILSFTCEEVWTFLGKDSIFLERLEDVDSVDLTLWNEILELRDVVNLKVEQAISEGVVKKSSELILNINLESFTPEEIKEIFKVADVKQSDSIYVTPLNGVKCLRCWLYFKKLEGDVCNRCKTVLENL